ncbi:ogr/Delta-like zinc finger family protein [Pantoea sp. Sc1]|uniref:ogr/Delta-like zinc finger family protein n=1 Tax=Pantoea sp. Sc1 TaxID=593105 RepID=UPI000906EC4B|nr:ogr/Delta-like zinc finger family protein [Pantoea sp. Sc1]
MMNCPKCSHAAHTRSSVQLSENTKERYNQCQNINCGCTFKSLETVTDIIMCPGKVNPAPPHPSRVTTKTAQGQLWL